MPENLLCMQLSHIRYANMDFFKTPHIQIQLLGKDPVFKYEFLVLFITPVFYMHFRKGVQAILLQLCQWNEPCPPG